MFKWFRDRLKKRDAGFTLIELVVVLAIIGILIAAAVPLYLGARKKAYKAEASNALQELKTMEWSYYQQYSTFVGGTMAAVGFNAPNSAFWTYANPTVSATSATMVATGIASTPVATNHVTVILNSDGSSSSSSDF